MTPPGQPGVGPALPRLRLRGEVAGGVRTWEIAPGPSSVGSVAGSTIVLPVRGVSRRHAMLTLGPAGLVLEDLGSRNGTMANGVRIQRTRLDPGDEVRIGPVVLRLELVEPADAELAIVVGGREPETVPGLDPGETTGVSASGGGFSGLALVEDVLVRLAVRPEPDLAGGLARLRRALAAPGAALFEPGSPTVVLASSGEVSDLSVHRGLQELLRRSGPGGEAVSATFPGSPGLVCAVRGSGAERLGLAVWGEPRLGRSETELVLRLLLTLSDLLRPRRLHGSGGAPPPAPGLAFPEGYVPGESPAMASLYSQMRVALQGDLQVLVLGETGVGKELLARILHDSSARRTGPYVAVNCAAIPAEQLEAEMFGVARRAATEVAERPGKFRLASGGTLFLDEIGEMPLALQPKLLRALQEREVQPVGGPPAPVDIQVVAATNSDLERRVEEGLFRRDLYYRVAGFVLPVPPLRERPEDLPALVEGFVRECARETGKSVRGVTVKALQALTAHDWPGNVRELRHEVRRLVLLCPDGQAIDSTLLSEHVRRASRPEGGAREEAPLSLELAPSMDRLERRLIEEALARSGGNRTQAARLLGISRNGLAIKMARLGIGG